MEQLISPEVKLDLLGLTEELEQEEGLTPAQVSQGTEGPQEDGGGLQVSHGKRGPQVN